MRGVVAVDDLDRLPGHHAQHVRMVAAALLVELHRILGNVERVVTQPVFHVDEHVLQVAIIYLDRLGLVGALAGGVLLMSIFCGLGAVPSNFTTPEMVATVAGSILAAGAAASELPVSRVAL